MRPDSSRCMRRTIKLYDLELAAVLFTIKLWRDYLYTVHVDVLTYHKILQYVFTQKELNLHQ